MNSTLTVALATLFIAGCAKEPPKCSDEDTFSIIRQIIIEQAGNIEGVSNEEYNEYLKIEFPRASSYDEKIKKYECAAKIIAGGHIELPITYESQLDDNNQHIVSVGDIGRDNLMAVRIIIADRIKKSRTAQEKSLVNESNTDISKSNSKQMMGEEVDEKPNANPNGDEEANKKKLGKPWQDEDGFVHYPDGSISGDPVESN